MIARNFPIGCVLHNGNKDFIRLTSCDIFQPTFDAPISGTLSFPIVSGTEKLLREFYNNLSYGYLEDWRVSYTNYQIGYVVKQINWLELSIVQSDAIYLTIHVDCEKQVFAEPPNVNTPFCSPSRVYTWNDGIVNVYQDEKILIPGQWIRQAQVRFDVTENKEIKATGTVVQLGESPIVFDYTKHSYSVETGFAMKHIIKMPVNIVVNGVKFRETPCYNENKDKLTLVEDTRFVCKEPVVKDSEDFTQRFTGATEEKYLKLVQGANGVLCTRFDYESVVDKSRR